MSDFGAKARKLMGGYSADDVEDVNDEFMFEDESADVAPLAPVEPLARPVHREVERREEQADLSRIVTVRPMNYNDAPSIAEPYRDGIPVIMNLSDVSDKDAQRFVDFAVGLTYGLQGVFERVTDRVFLLSPRTVEVTGDVTGNHRSASIFGR